VTRVVEKVFARLGFRLTQRKLGQTVPVVGVLFGAGMNAKLLMSVTDDAEHIYRERFLRERYGLPAHDALPATHETIDDTEVIDMVEVPDEEPGKEDDAGEEPTDT
jgi:hypothetical protein